MFVSGFVICAIPQAMCNKSNIQELSIRVPTERFFNGENLFYCQLQSGLTVQRYDTHVGNQYPVPGIIFNDNAGTQILKNENITKIINISQYLGLVIKYPLGYMGIMARHCINLLHLPYRHGYNQYIYHHNSVNTVLNFSVIFIFLIGLFYCKYSSTFVMLIKNFKFAVLLVLFLPSFIIIPGAPEPRFIMSFYIFMYAFVTYKLLNINFCKVIWQHKVWFLCLYLVTLAICCAVWGNTFASAVPISLILR